VAVGKGESKPLVINETEGVVVKEIFELFAAAVSLKKIAKCLNERCLPSPRSRSSNSGTWCPTAIRAILKRELYKGEIVWNRSKFVKVPGTNKRRSRPRPESERKRFSAPELAIVSEDLWNKVQSRFKLVCGDRRGQSKPGLFPRSLTSPYLFSGLLKCGLCGSSLIIASGGGKKPKYVCSGYFNRGICTNKLYIRQDELEERLLGKLQTELLQPEAIELAIESFGRQLRSSLANVSNELTEMRARKEKLEREIRNFTQAIAESGHSKYILEEISVREKEISGITNRLLSSTPDSIQTQIEEMRRLVEGGIQNLQNLFREESPAAKQELRRHLSAVLMFPLEDGEGWYFSTGDGVGAVFELSLSGGSSTEQVIYTYGNQNPCESGLTFDESGNIFGTTWGEVFELSPNGQEGWSSTVIHSFAGSPKDGDFANGTPTVDQAGNLYGTTTYGGVKNYGTVYKLTP